MRKLFVIALAGILCLAPLTGCVTATNPSGVITIGNTTIDPVATGVAIRIASKLGAEATINAKPETRQYFMLSSSVIKAAIATGNYNPTNIVKSITSATGSSTVGDSVADAINLYQAFFGQIIDAKITNSSPYILPALTGLANGIDDAVALTAGGVNVGAHYKPIAATPLLKSPKPLK